MHTRNYLSPNPTAAQSVVGGGVCYADCAWGIDTAISNFLRRWLPILPLLPITGPLHGSNFSFLLHAAHGMPSFDRTTLHDLTLLGYLRNHTCGARACRNTLHVSLLTIRSGVVLLRSFGGAFGAWLSSGSSGRPMRGCICLSTVRSV
jgi:hypothetical protein